MSIKWINIYNSHSGAWHTLYGWVPFLLTSENFLITDLIFKISFISGFLITILYLPTRKMLCPNSQLSNAKFCMELYYCLWPIPPLPCFIHMVRPSGTCCHACVQWVTDLGADPTIWPTVLSWLMCNPFSSSRIRQKIFTQVYIYKCLFKYSVVLDLLPATWETKKQMQTCLPFYIFFKECAYTERLILPSVADEFWKTS